MLLLASHRWKSAGANRVNIAKPNSSAEDGEVEEGEQHEDDQRGDEGDQELRQVLAEVSLELLDPVDHRDHDRAGTLEPEVGGAERHHLCVEPLAQPRAARAPRCDGAIMARACSIQPRSTMTAATSRKGMTSSGNGSPAKTRASSQPSSASRPIPTMDAHTPITTVAAIEGARRA